MKQLTILYDASCGLCRQCRHWFETQPSFFPLEFLALQSPKVDLRFPEIRQYRPNEQLIAIDETGAFYQGGDAWIICLYALEEYRELSEKMSQPFLRPYVRRVCELISKNRLTLSTLLHLSTSEEFQETLTPYEQTDPSLRWDCQCKNTTSCSASLQNLKG